MGHICLPVVEFCESEKCLRVYFLLSVHLRIPFTCHLIQSDM